MNKSEHAERLRAAMARKGLERQDVADAVGVVTRTITNWTTGKTTPSERERIALRALLGPYDTAGDPVELAVRASELTEDRQDTVVGFYKRNLREQKEGRTA